MKNFFSFQKIMQFILVGFPKITKFFFNFFVIEFHSILSCLGTPLVGG